MIVSCVVRFTYAYSSCIQHAQPVNQAQAIDDSRLRPGVRAQFSGATWRVSVNNPFRRRLQASVFAPLCENVTSPTKPEVHSITLSRQWGEVTSQSIDRSTSVAVCLDQTIKLCLGQHTNSTISATVHSFIYTQAYGKTAAVELLSVAYFSGSGMVSYRDENINGEIKKIIFRSQQTRVN